MEISVGPLRCFLDVNKLNRKIEENSSIKAMNYISQGNTVSIHEYK